MLGNIQGMFLMCWRLSKLYEQVRAQSTSESVDVGSVTHYLERQFLLPDLWLLRCSSHSGWRRPCVTPFRAILRITSGEEGSACSVRILWQSWDHASKASMYRSRH